MAAYEKYKTATLEKMLSKAKEKYFGLTVSQNGNTWGYGMRHNRLASLTSWERQKERIENMEKELLKRKSRE